MPKRSVPRYALHKSSGLATVKIGKRNHYLGKYGSPESHAKYATLIREWQETQTDAPKDLTVGTLTAMYLEHCQVHYRKHGRETSEVQANRDTMKRVNSLFSKTLAAEFKPRMLKAVRQAMIDEGLARSTINGAAGRIRRMFRWAIGDGNEMVPAAVLTGLECVRDLQYGRTSARETEPVKSVPDAFVDAIRPFVTRQVWGIVQFSRMTGARPTEALIVRGCDLNMSGDIWEYRPATHKTEHHGKTRMVFIGNDAQEVLRSFLSTDLQKYLFSPREAVAEMLARRCRPGSKMREGIGERYSVHSYDKAIERACDKAGVPKWTPNQLRHSFGTRARRAGGIEAARAALGHSSAVTSEIYAEQDAEVSRELLRKIG